MNQKFIFLFCLFFISLVSCEGNNLDEIKDNLTKSDGIFQIIEMDNTVIIFINQIEKVRSHFETKNSLICIIDENFKIIDKVIVENKSEPFQPAIYLSKERFISEISETLVTYDKKLGLRTADIGLPALIFYDDGVIYSESAPPAYVGLRIDYYTLKVLSRYYDSLDNLDYKAIMQGNWQLLPLKKENITQKQQKIINLLEIKLISEMTDE